LPDAATAPPSALAFLVNGGPESPMGQRAAAFAARLDSRWRITTVHREGSRRAARRVMQQRLREGAPDLVYVLDLAAAGVAAAAWHRARTGTPFVADTGDAITALARQSGRPLPALAATAAVEQIGLRAAAHVIVRGTSHQALLAARGIHATLVPDGVDTALFAPGDRAAARGRLGWGREFVVAVIGSSIWNERAGMAYGWDLVELLGILRDLPIRGVLVGDGSGLERLRARASALGVLDRLSFIGRQPLASLPDLIVASDVCLSTQSADTVGEVRTTGKLPLYMACGAYVLASAVGEARRVLPAEMLVPYEGARDDAYPGRLAERVRPLVGDRSLLARGTANVAVARRLFDYDALAARVDAVLRATLSGARA
jgi:glycosyltransferase involved in cell wall biosynthesis